ncbi:MAG: LruC domain-containing protein [Schleiferiaceae bacterium]|nr:LruC domain-containing protein [Schleiferiaceae bacterium]
MKIPFKILAVATTLLVLASCNRDDDNSRPGRMSLAESKAPTGFIYEATNQFTVAFNLVSQNTNVSVVKILDNKYNTLRSITVNGTGGQILMREPALQDEYFIYIPEANVIQSFKREGRSTINLTIDLDNGKNKSSMIGSATPPTIDCGAAQNLPSNLTLSGAHTVAKSFNGSISWPNGTEILDVCENSTLTGVSVWSAGSRTIRVAEGATLTITANNLERRINIINMGTIVLQNGLGFGGEFINFGTVVSNSTSQINPYHTNGNPASGAEFFNYGTFSTNGNFNFNSSETGYNFGTINAATMQINQNRAFVNECQINVSGNLSFNTNADVTNSGYIGVGGFLHINSSSEVNMTGSTAVIRAQTMTLDNNMRFIATGGTGIVTVVDNMLVNFPNWDANNSGLMEFCVGSSSGNGANTLPTGFSYGCTAFVPVGPCNPVQIGTPSIVDNDGDGVPAGIDYDDNDPTIAFREEAPYMIVNSFEDLWPAKGDYDFNDLVIKQRPVTYRHANNNITKIEYKFVIHAIGAGLSNGLALQMLQPTSGNNGYELISNPIVTSVSSPFQLVDDNLIQMAPNVRNLQSSFYTNVGDGPIQVPDTITFTVNLDYNATQPAVVLSDFFIFRTNNIGHEVHLPGRQSSLRVDNTLYGLADDDTDPATKKWYLTANNLPWGIEIVEQEVSWKHPKSKIAIDEAYPEFLNWVMSAGNNNQAWAKNPNLNKVFFFPGNN